LDLLDLWALLDPSHLWHLLDLPDLLDPLGL
jgi:hypothetical protein